MSRRPVDRRRFLASTAGSAVAATGLAHGAAAADAIGAASPSPYDLIVMGGGNAGMPAAIFAAKRGARVLIVEAAGQLGGTLHLSSGQMSAAGTKLQKSKGIADTPQIFYDDIMRISRNTADPVITRLAVENSAATFDWLMDKGLDVYPTHPETGTTHEPYSRARYAWGKSGGRSILRILNEELQPQIDAGRVKVLFNTKVTGLTKNAAGAVTGVEVADQAGKSATYQARSVLLTSGGAASNPDMFEKMDHIKDYNDDSYPYSQGEGITLGLSAGGYLWNQDTHAPLFGAILSDDDYPSALLQIFRPWPPSRPPFEIFVNVKGERFLQEDVASHDVYEQSLLKQPGTLSWVVFDDAMLDAAPPIMNPKRWDRDQYRALFNKQTFFHRADTVEELARLAGIDPDGLTATVAAYNQGQAKGVDALGRKHMPLPIAKGPFYAIKLHSWKFTTYAGLAVDGQLRVVRTDGSPVPGLYAAGEIIGTGATMGRAVCGGMSVTPALTFGRLLGQKIVPVQRKA